MIGKQISIVHHDSIQTIYSNGFSLLASKQRGLSDEYSKINKTTQNQNFFDANGLLHMDTPVLAV